MAGIRTHQFAQKTITASGITTLYTVPAGHRAVIKWAEFHSTVVAPGYCWMGATNGSGDYQFLVLEQAAARHTVYGRTSLYAVLEAGDDLLVAIGSVTGGDAYCGAGGVLFEL